MNSIVRMSVLAAAAMAVVACGSDDEFSDPVDTAVTTDAPTTSTTDPPVDEASESSAPDSAPDPDQALEEVAQPEPDEEPEDGHDGESTDGVGDLAAFCERSAVLYSGETDFTTDPTGAAEVMISLADVAPEEVAAEAEEVAEAFRAVDVTDEAAVLQVFEPVSVLIALTELDAFTVENCDSSAAVDESSDLDEPEVDDETVEPQASITGLEDFLAREYRDATWRLRLTRFEVVENQIGAGGDNLGDDAPEICDALSDYASGFDSMDFVRVIETSGSEEKIVARGEAGVSCRETVPPNGGAGTVDTPPADLVDPVYDPFGFDDEIDPDERSRLGLLNFFDSRYTDAPWRTSIETSRSMGSEVFGVGLMGVDPESDDVIAVCDAALEYFARFGGPIRFEVRTFESGTDIATDDETLAAIGSLRQGCTLVEG